MNTLFNAHLQEVHASFTSGDTALGLRRLTDCAIETQNPDIFRETLSYYEWLEEINNTDDAVNTARAIELLEKIRNVGVAVNERPADKILTVNNVGKTYRKSGFKIKDLAFSLSEKQIVGLVGENGNGKTTLLRLLAAELLPDTGGIEYHFAQQHKEQYQLKTKLIYIEQRIPRWHGTLMDNLRFVLPYYGIKGPDGHLWADIMIARLGLRPFRHLTWNRISSGYRTRFELAKTLLRQPKILLLDEPLANLDIVSQQTILQDLKFMANSITMPFGMILSSQHIYEVEKVSNDIIFIKNGIPQYQNNTPTEVEQTVEKSALIIELEINNNRDALAAAFTTLPLQKIQYNGGVYLLHFDEGTKVSAVLQALAAKQLEPNYLRNISQSSRRFFIN